MLSVMKKTIARLFAGVSFKFGCRLGFLARFSQDIRGATGKEAHPPLRVNPATKRAIEKKMALWSRIRTSTVRDACPDPNPMIEILVKLASSKHVIESRVAGGLQVTLANVRAECSQGCLGEPFL